MKCPQTFQIEITNESEVRLAGAECGEGECAWYDEKKKQCCIKTLSQQVNFNVRVAK